ncbi:hypothetical protein G1K97_04745 [Tenacibaculum finnmarkense]|uniref:MobV family relaxase n=1 Tax=Tenacibaculum finnmarkense TaxID=2781243 RepID=UPI001EFBA103|nr:MobV family relaxase [Tenacibaculum finnmarkense]MCG8847960.1 hypothetical protein [Tenacibaculum finnmarkense]MCG8892613.1 hypothetical protein [Tenacibaculum finnmarkense]MCG8901151.1 hypothetical protein [Tenacibaculum finnmarkense]
MSYAILRMQKLKGSGADLKGISIHIDRSNNGESISPKNADSNRINSNIHWDQNGKVYTQEEWTKYSKEAPLYKRINNDVKERYTSKRKIRANAVKAIEYIMTSDNVMMENIFRENRAEEWIKDNKRFLEQVYGKNNILSIHLNLDELTPHLHAIIVPITNDGRLCCKDFINKKTDLINQQTLYASMMEKYGMIRGEKGSSTRHQKPNTFNQNKNYERNSH